MHQLCVFIYTNNLYEYICTYIHIWYFRFPNLGIQCKKKAELKDALTLRQQIRVDPFRSKHQQNLSCYSLHTPVTLHSFCYITSGQCCRMLSSLKCFVIHSSSHVLNFYSCISAGFDHMEKPQLNNINLMVVKLCFQVFLPDNTGKYQRPLPPVTSSAIHDKSKFNGYIVVVNLYLLAIREVGMSCVFVY